MYSVMTQIHTYPLHVLCIVYLPYHCIPQYLIAHRTPYVWLRISTLIPTVYILSLVTELHLFRSASSTLPSSLYFHHHIYLVHVKQNMIVMIIIIMVSPHSLSGSFVALSSSSTGTQAQAIPLTAQTWNPPYTFMLTVCQRLKGKCTKVIRYWGCRISGEIELNFRAGWWLL